MASAKQLPSGTWRILVYLGKDERGKDKRKSITAPTKWECEKLADEFLQGRREQPKNLTVGECIDKYIEVRENILSPSTLRGYKQIRVQRLQMLMGIPALKLTSQEVQQAVSADALRLSRKSISEAVHLISSALKMQGIHLDLSITYPPRKSEIVVLPEPQEVIKAVTGTSIELPCLLAVCLGLRCSEIRALTKSDLQDDMLYIHRRKLRIGNKDVLQDINKTESSCRVIRCPQAVIDKINACETEGLCPLTYPQLSGRFRRLMKANNLDITFHGLRHINATAMRRLGIPDKCAMARGGWATPEVMKNAYQNIFTKEQIQADETINKYFNEIINSSTEHNTEHRTEHK